MISVEFFGLAARGYSKTGSTPAFHMLKFSTISSADAKQGQKAKQSYQLIKVINERNHLGHRFLKKLQEMQKHINV